LPLRLQLRVEDTGAGPAARFVCDDALPPDPLRERALTLVRCAPAPLSTDALRTTLGVRKQTLLGLLQRLVADDLIRRAGREGWVVGNRTVPVPDSMGGNGNAPAK
jgi:hypothetical protein